jgi:hypothetical protein
MIRNLENENRQLRKELQLHDLLAGRANAGSYEALTAEDLRDLQVTVEQYLSGNLETIEVTSLRQVQEIFGMFRKMSRKSPETSETAKTVNAENTNDPAVKSRTESLKTNDPANNIAPDDLRPPTLLPSEAYEGEGDKKKTDQRANPFTSLALYKTLTTKNERLRKANAQTAFEEFLKKEASEVKRLHENLLEQLKERRRTLKETQLKCNELKKQWEADADNKDEAKKGYRESVELIALLKTEIDNITIKIDAVKLDLVPKFNSWYSKQNLEKSVPEHLKQTAETENDTVFRKSLINAKILHSRLMKSNT